MSNPVKNKLRHLFWSLPQSLQFKLVTITLLLALAGALNISMET